MEAVKIQEARQVEAGTLDRLDGIMSAFAARMDGTSPAVGLKWPSGFVSYAPKRALGQLAGTFAKSEKLTIAHGQDAVTFAEWGTGRMILCGPPFGGRSAIAPLARCLELASEPGKVAEKADKLIEELGLAAQAKPKKPSKAEALRAKIASLEVAEKSAAEVVTRDERYARIDTSAIERARKLYSIRRAALRGIVEEMSWTIDGAPGSKFRGLLAEFTPALPAKLVDSALAVARIPQAHNVKRMAAAIQWHEEAVRWVDICIGAEDHYRVRSHITYGTYKSGHYETKLSPTHVKEEYQRITKQQEYSPWGPFSGRLDYQQDAEQAKRGLADDTAKLTKIRTDLLMARVKLQQEEDIIAKRAAKKEAS